MKRLIFALFFLTVGIGLGGGGLYVGLNWDRFNPFKKPTDDPIKHFVAKLRKACATDETLKGTIITSGKLADGRLVLSGLIAKAEQKALVDGKAKALLEETPELANQCGNGISTDGVKVLNLLEQLAGLQGDFDAGRGAEADARKREIMRATRVDSVTINEDGQLAIAGVSVRGNTQSTSTDDALLAILRERLNSLGLTGESVPELALKIQHFANPAGALRKKLQNDDRAKGLRLVSAWFDGKGILHLEGIAANAGQQKIVEETLAGMLKEPALQPIVKAQGDGTTFRLALAELAPAIDLHKRWIEHAHKENKPNLERLRLETVAPAISLNEKQAAIADDEGNPHYHFRVKGQFLETAGEQKEAEKALTDWIKDQLPKVLNQNQTLMAAKLELEVRSNPIFALQERVVQRGLDGTAFIDARFDESGRLRLFGRLHEPGVEAVQALDVAIKDLLVKEQPWTMDLLKAHESAKEGSPIAWKAVERQCQATLAKDRATGQRARLDRLYFAYEKQQLKLLADGIFLTDFADEDPTRAIAKTIDDVLASRGAAEVSTSSFRRPHNPLTELQNFASERTDLDGVLLTAIRFNEAGTLTFDGYLGIPEQKATLTAIVAAKLDKIPGVVRIAADKKANDWTLDGMKQHSSAKGEWKWAEVVRTAQGELAGDAFRRRAYLARAYFKYVELKSPDKVGKSRSLTLHCKGTFLTRPDEPPMKILPIQKFEFLRDIAIDQIQNEFTPVLMPIFELQQQAVKQSYDGLLFKDAYFDREGKLTFAGLHGNAGQLAQAQSLIDKLLADKESRAVAPAGVAALTNLKLVSWEPMLFELRTNFADDKISLFNQTRIDRAYFGYDEKHELGLHIVGICIYQHKLPPIEEQYPQLEARLKTELATRGLTGFGLRLASLDRKANPQIAWQKEANDRQMDGVVFERIGFDAKRTCYVFVPFMPKGQAENVRKLIEDSAAKYKHLGTVVQR